ncbi:GntR family transcriptional regulator [Pseudonocardia sp. NPDC049635]|uniref:GntR family transcriptional regulator n=1 Tax=Pseudonocardia sp. NPDC049635 TaxID=3155506 RepID=UPI003403EC01
MTEGKYLKIADELADELARSAPGTRVAGEYAIGRRFAVGRAAARAALQELERRLVVRRVQGVGTFVNRRLDYTISRDRRPSWHETVTAAGGAPRSVIREIDVHPLPEQFAALLRRPVGTPCHHLVRHSYADDLLAAVGHEWVPTDVVTDLEPAMRAGESLDLVLRQIAPADPERVWCRVSLDVAPAEVCAGLLVDRSRPVWLVESLSRDRTSGRPLMCSTSWMRADAVRVVVEMGSTADDSRKGDDGAHS